MTWRAAKKSGRAEPDHLDSGTTSLHWPRNCRQSIKRPHRSNFDQVETKRLINNFHLSDNGTPYVPLTFQLLTTSEWTCRKLDGSVNTWVKGHLCRILIASITPERSVERPLGSSTNLICRNEAIHLCVSVLETLNRRRCIGIGFQDAAEEKQTSSDGKSSIYDDPLVSWTIRGRRSIVCPCAAHVDSY